MTIVTGMNLFEFEDYKTYVRERIENMPKKGRGEFRRIAEVLGVSSTIVSHVFKGDRHLTSDQALQLSIHLGLNPLETRFFLTLVSMERAATHQLKDYYREELKTLAEQSKAIKNRLRKEIDVISEEFEAQYFSDWKYVAFHLMTALPGYNNIDAISEYFQLPRDQVQQIVTKLINNRLLVEEDGELSTGPINAHLDASKSQLINAHRRNWRLKSLEKINRPASTDTFYSFLTTITPEVQEKIRGELLEVIARINKLGVESDVEELHCMNIDWFQVR